MRPARGATIGGVAVILVALASLGAWRWWAQHDGESASPPASKSASVPRRAPPEPQAPPLEAAHPLPPDAIEWPAVGASGRAIFEEGRRLIEEAARAYARGESAGDAALLARADAMMLAGLARIARAGVRVAALRAYHDETLLRPLAAGAFDELAKRAEFALAQYPDDLFALRASMIADERRRRYVSAVESALRLLASRPLDSEAREVMAIACYKMGRFADATEHASKLARQRPDSPDIWRLLAESASELGDAERGVPAVEEMLRAIAFPDPACWDSERARVALASAIKVLHRFREFTRLREVAAFYSEREPSALWAVGAEGVALLETGDAVAAVPLLRRALEDDENTQEERFHLGIALSRQRLWRDAASEFVTILQDDPYFNRAYYQLGLCASRLDDTSAADALFAMSSELSQSHRDIERYRQHRAAGALAEAVRARARGQVARGLFADAARTLAAPGLDSDPSITIERFEFAILCLRSGDAREGISRLEELIGSGHADIVGCRAQLLATTGERDAAIDTLSSLIAKPGASNVWRRRLATLLLEESRPREAAAVLSSLDPKSVQREDTLLRARTELALGHGAEAIELLDSISPGDLRFDEWRIGALRALALCVASQPSIDARRALESVPPRMRNVPLWLEARAATLDAALSDGNTALARELDAVDREWSEARDARPAYERARTELARSDRPNAATHLRCATLASASGDRDAARRHAELALYEDPANADAHAVLAGLLLRDEEAYLRLWHLRQAAAARPGDDQLRRQIAAIEERWSFRER